MNKRQDERLLGRTRDVLPRYRQPWRAIGQLGNWMRSAIPMPKLVRVSAGTLTRFAIGSFQLLRQRVFSNLTVREPDFHGTYE